MSTTQEATINPDGSTHIPPNANTSSYEETFKTENNTTFNSTSSEEGDILNSSGTDPAVYLLIAVVIIGIISFLYYQRRKKSAEDANDEFFNQLDGEKFNLKLPAAVDEYYTIKDKIIDQGWEPGQKKDAQGGGPHRVLAQALMKRCIADIPLVTHIQKESSGMNKLYSHSMCSVKQWRTYQAAEAMVSAEVDEVRAEADEIEPGWSEVIWRQAMQYHQMLKQRHDTEAKAKAEQDEKKRMEEEKVLKKKREEEEARNREIAAEQAAQELIKQEERERESKTAFNNGKIKKGFLNKKK